MIKKMKRERDRRFGLRLLVVGLLLNTSVLVAQDLSGISICIDPGHGAGTRNQGPTGLREAEVNLSVGLFWRDLLKRANIDTVLMTRTTDAENPKLWEREYMANTFGVTWFHSIHHNATGGTNTSSRYTLMLYEELANRQPQWPGQSDVMSERMGRSLWLALRTSDYRIFGDYTFYGSPSYLGVLNDLQMPGELSEATFHDHPVEEAKLRNPDFRRLEALGLHYAVLEYFDAGGMPTGTLSGIIRDALTRQPINGAHVLLLPDSLEYTTDTWKNGLYAFHDLPPGPYRLRVTAPDYITAEKEVALDSNRIQHVDFNLVSAIPPTVVAIKPKHGASGIAPLAKIFIKFSQTMDAESVEQAFRIEPPVAGTLLADRLRRVFTFESVKGMEAGVTYTVRIDSSAKNTFGLPLDGDGDGTGGDGFSFQFTVAPLDTTVPMVLVIEPGRRMRDVDVYQPIRVQFNRAIDPASAIWSQSILVSSNRGGVSYRLDWPAGADHRWLTLVPNWPLQPDARINVTLRRTLKDQSGTGLLEALSWEYSTESQTGNPETISDFRGEDNPFADPLTQTATRGVDEDSLRLEIVPLPYYFASGALQLSLRFSEPDGNLRLAFAAEDIQVDSSDVAYVAVYGDSSGARLRWLFEEESGRLSRAVPIDWWGWRMLRYCAGRDSLVDENGQTRLQGPVGLRWLGFDIQADSTDRVELYFDDLQVRKPENVVAVRQEENLPHRFEVLPPQPNPVTRDKLQVRIDFILPAAQAVEVAVYDVLGRRVFARSLEQWRAGRNRFIWNGRDEHGRRVGPGLYFVRFRNQSQQVTRKILILP